MKLKSPRKHWISSLAAGTSLIGTLVAADTPPPAVAPIKAPFTPAKERRLESAYLLSDLGGARTSMLEKGITFDLQYVNDYFAVLGGKTTGGGSKDFGRVRLTVDLDLEKLAGISGLTFHVSAINQTGPNIGATIGSYSNPSSIAGQETTRIDTFWLQQKLFDGLIVLRVGQLAQQDDYGVQEYGGSYLLEPLGYAFGNLFGNVTATFDPASKPGVEIQIHPVKGFYLKSMLQSGDPDPYGNDESGLSFSTKGDGVLATEIGYRTEGSTIDAMETGYTKDKQVIVQRDGIKTLWEGLPAVYKLGYYRNFGTFTDPRSGSRRDGNYLIYGMINQAIFREGHFGAAAERGLDAFIGADYSPESVSFAYFQLTGGVRYTGLIPGRDRDTTALGIVVTDFSKNFDTATTRYSTETALEFSYKAQVTKWLTIQPDFQVFFNPGGQSARDNAYLLGVRANVVF